MHLERCLREFAQVNGIVPESQGQGPACLFVVLTYFQETILQWQHITLNGSTLRRMRRLKHGILGQRTIRVDFVIFSTTRVDFVILSTTRVEFVILDRAWRWYQACLHNASNVQVLVPLFTLTGINKSLFLCVITKEVVCCDFARVDLVQ